VPGGHAVEIFVDRAHQHLPPEAVDRARRLPLLQQPVAHADFVQILPPCALAANCPEPARDGQLVAHIQTFHFQECAGEVKWRRQPAAAQNRGTPARFQEIELAIEADTVAHAKPRIKVEQVYATAEQDVLAIVDGLGFAFARRHRIGRGAASKKRPRFKQIDFESGAAQRRRRGQASQSATGN
jgi:hypothetical protein